MKTLVVLSALAAVALAAPALHEDGSEDYKKTITNFPGIFKRERKSPQQSSHPDNLTPGAPTNGPLLKQISEPGVSGRSFGAKPIIIKKKPVGYHIYRDSDEEAAESGETCGKQVKVKFCDTKLEDKMKNSNIEDSDTHMTEEDMKQSIKHAKEAVENLQQDLKIVEKKPSTQESLWNHGRSESDAELHKDIEVTREALEHIHKNFGNLESLSLHATTLKEADTIDDAHFIMAKSEEQRLAQWKEAMDTIQKNVEIARNIEDSFRSTSAEAGQLFSDGMMINNNHEVNKATDHMRTPKDMATKDDKNVDPEKCKKHAHEKSSDKDTKPVSIEDDMTSSATTMSEKTMKNLHKPEKTTKDADLDSLMASEDTQQMSAMDSMKPLEETKERKAEESDKKLAKAERADSGMPDTLVNKIKSVESEDMLIEQERHTAATPDKTQPQKILKHDESLEKMETTAPKNPEMKSAEHFDEKLSGIKQKESEMQHENINTEQPKEVDTTMLMKSAEEASTNMQKELLANVKPQQKTALDNNFEKHEPKMANQNNLKQQSGTTAPFDNPVPLQFRQHKQALLHPEMRAVEDFENIHQHHLVDPSQTRWAQDKNFHMQMESMKSADAIHSQTMDHVHTVQHPGHHHHLTHNMKNHVDNLSGHGQHQSRFPDNFMAQGKAADVDMQSYYMSMRDGSGLRPENHQFRWKPTHESSRSAYGAPAASASASSSSSGGAVGLFPNANVGGCGIPLLLSCNPSVVSGSLAKAHPAPYSAPAYRTEEDFNFHTKRDVKKTQNTSSLNRTPNVNLKTSTVLVAKQ